MSSMLEEIAGILGGEGLGQLAGTLGADDQALSRGVAAALPALLGGLARNAQRPDGASDLFGAVSRDHDGSILDSLGMILGDSPWAQQQASRHGDSILGHVFGDQRGRLERHVERSSGLSSTIVSKLLPLLAPIVLGYIGRKLRGEGSNDERLAQDLRVEQENVRRNDSVLGSVIDMLDGENDGGLADIAGDLLTGPAGRAILGKLLSR